MKGPLLTVVEGPELTLWLIGLGIGLVVVVVVIALLTLLVRLVHYIDVGVAELWEMATRLAANTATTWQLQGTLHTSRALREELRRHQQLLEGQR